MISTVLMKGPKLGGIFSIEMLPVKKWTYCAIVQEPVLTTAETAHTISVTNITEGWVSNRTEHREVLGWPVVWGICFTGY